MQHQGGTAKQKPWTRPVAKWVGWVVVCVCLVFVAWLARSVRIGAVLSDSMTPTLKRGDVYVIRIDAYRQEGPERGEIVVINKTTGEEPLVKRVMGIEGDLVGVMFGRVWINGVWVEEPYIEQRPGIRERPTLTKVPDGHLFLLGDNRNFSEDSRDIGTLPVENVLGMAVAIIAPRGRRCKLEHYDLEVPPPGNFTARVTR